MKVISIQIGHNATVALAEDGAVCGVLSQEKCDNIKNSSVSPHDAITALLAELRRRLAIIALSRYLQKNHLWGLC